MITAEPPPARAKAKARTKAKAGIKSQAKTAATTGIKAELTKKFEITRQEPAVNPVPVTPSWESKPYCFTVDQYHALAETSVIAAKDRVELIHGKIYAMPPIGPKHSAHTSSFGDLIYLKCPKNLAVRLGDPVFLPPDSEPQPDLAVVKRRKDFYVSALPRPDDIKLLIEVADSTVKFDIGAKARLYAQAGIPEYWVLDLPAQRIRLFREPAADGYAVEEVLARGKTVRCGTVPELVFEVGELLL